MNILIDIMLSLIIISGLLSIIALFCGTHNIIDYNKAFDLSKKFSVIMIINMILVLINYLITKI